MNAPERRLGRFMTAMAENMLTGCTGDASVSGLSAVPDETAMNILRRLTVIATLPAN